jgi:hypothetical protein
MDLYPLNLVLAAATASATVFLGYLPTRLLRQDVLFRQPFRLGGAWLVVAVTSGPAIFHYHIVLALLCFIAGWRLRGGHLLGGKLWLSAAAALGLGVGVVLILAVTPGAWASGAPFVFGRLFFLLWLYMAGAVIGLAYTLYVFTRPEASHAGVDSSGPVRLLRVLIWVQAVQALFYFLALASVMRLLGSSWLDALFSREFLALFCLVVVLPLLGRLAWRRCRSPRPSEAALSLLAIIAVGIVADLLWLK